VIAYARGDRRVRALVERAERNGDTLVVPPAVVTQTLRGGARDAPVFRLLGGCVVPPVGLALARLAGELLGTAGTTDIADAQIVAEAISGSEATIVTGDPIDIRTLLAGRPGVHVLAI
jgi:hypothetical protein